MTAIEARDLYDKFTHRTQIQRIDDAIRVAAGQGERFLRVPGFDSVTASLFKEHYKSLGFFVSKVLDSADQRGSYDTYSLEIWWKRDEEN